jgi:hypothetical protein
MEELEGLLELNKSEGIYIDIGTQVYLEIEGVNFSATSIFIGMLKDEFMIFTLPKRYKSIKDKLLPSDTLVVKYLYEGSIYAFQTKVIETITNPIKALALGYPKVVQKRELRIAKKKIFSMVVFDISKKGCRFKYRENIKSMSSLREGDLLRIYCKFPGVADEIGAMACVKNIKRAQGQFTIGAEFQDMTKAFLMPLMQFLFSIEDFS